MNPQAALHDAKAHVDLLKNEMRLREREIEKIEASRDMALRKMKLEMESIQQAFDGGILTAQELSEGLTTIQREHHEESTTLTNMLTQMRCELGNDQGRVARAQQRVLDHDIALKFEQNEFDECVADDGTPSLRCNEMMVTYYPGGIRVVRQGTSSVSISMSAPPLAFANARSRASGDHEEGQQTEPLPQEIEKKAKKKTAVNGKRHRETLSPNGVERAVKKRKLSNTSGTSCGGRTVASNRVKSSNTFAITGDSNSQNQASQTVGMGEDDHDETSDVDESDESEDGEDDLE